MTFTKKGFTLIEMLIVIVIIGILAAALIPRLTGIQARARDTARKADLQQIGTALATYKLDTASYPYSPTAWVTGIENTFLTGLNSYMTSFPKESNPAIMSYAYISNSYIFALAAVSEGGKANANWSGATASPIAVPASFSGGFDYMTPTSLASQLCTDGAISDLCVGTVSSGAPRYVYVN